MKSKLFFLSCLLLITCSIDASNNGYFPAGMKWTTIISGQEDCGGEFLCVIQGDTIIEGKTYQTIKFNDNLLIPILGNDKQIYLHVNHKDYLLYDFNLNEGDSISLFSLEESTGIVYDETGYVYVTKVDTITLLDGRQARRQFYSGSRGIDIEFIGNSEGLLRPVELPSLPMCWASIQACCSVNGEPLYETSPNFCNDLDVDAISNAVIPSSASKLLQDGQIFILRGDKTYTTTGQEVQ